MNKKLTYIFLGIIVLTSILTRFVKLSKYPPAITWDEAAVGYNAYTIIHWGKDEWGKILPLTFKSFGDDKNPVHVYLTAPFIGIFGLNEFATRAPAALFGVLNVIVIFFLVRVMFKSDTLALISALFLSVSPYNIQFSRFNHELNFAIFFFIAGVYFLYIGLRNKKYLLISFLLLGLDLLTYHSAKVVTPVLVLLLIVLNFKKLIKTKKHFFTGLAIYLFFVSLLFIKPELLGGARFKQNPIGTPQVVWARYKEYFEPRFLFISGESNPRHSIQTVGTFYWLDLPLLVIGLLGILWRLIIRKNKQMLLLLAWVFIAPLPGAVSSAVPHSARAMFITGSWTMVSAYGAYLLITLLKNKYYRIIMSVVLILSLTPFIFKYLKDYYGKYTQRYAIEWIYGMKNIVKYSQQNDFNEVYMTDSRMQPYIFFLYYLKTPLPEFLSTVKYNETQSRSSNLVASFKNYHFMWDEYHSMPEAGVLYVVRPSVYDGLYQKTSFDVVKLIRYPDKSDAFYMILAK